MQIGNVKLQNNVFLAPMAGVCDMVYRNICRKMGAGFSYSEMVSAKGLFYNDKKTAELLRKGEFEAPFAVQIFGCEPDIMAYGAKKAIEISGCEVLDINFGCPAPKIVNNGDGSAVLKNIDLIKQIATSVVSAVNIPITAKIRAGWDSDSINAIEVAKALESCGISAITLHPRTRQMFYSGNADWSLIKAVKENVKIPVIGSGDLFCAEDVVAMLSQTGADAVMIARGAQGNPFIFKQTLELLETGTVSYFPTAKERLQYAISHTEALCRDKGAERGIKEARKHMAWYIKGLPGASALRLQLFNAKDIKEAKALIDDAIAKL